MKKGLYVFLALIIAATIGLAACQKKEQPAMPPASEMEERAVPPATEEPSTSDQEAPSEEHSGEHTEESN